MSDTHIRREVDAIIAEANRKDGWTVKRNKASITLLGPDGVRVVMALTPSDWRSIRNTRAYLRRAGFYGPCNARDAEVVDVDLVVPAITDQAEALGMSPIDYVADMASHNVVVGNEHMVAKVIETQILDHAYLDPLTMRAEEAAAKRRAERTPEPDPITSPEEPVSMPIPTEPTPTLRDALLAHVNTAGHPVTIDDAVALFPDNPPASVGSTLNYLARTNQLRRIGRGLYVSLDAPELPLTTRERGAARKVMVALRDADGPLMAEELATATGLTRDKVMRATNYLVNLGQIRRLITGMFEFVETTGHIEHDGVVAHQFTEPEAPVATVTQIHPAAMAHPAFGAPEAVIEPEAKAPVSASDALALLELIVPSGSIKITHLGLVNDWVAATQNLLNALAQ